MSKVLRYYAIASFVVMLIAAAAIATSFRSAAIRSVESVGQNSNLELAQIAIEPIRPALVGYLAAIEPFEGREATTVPLPRELRDAIAALMQDSRVKRITLYNAHGVVSYSTDPQQIGDMQATNDGFEAAISGRVLGKLISNDFLDEFQRDPATESMIETYVPVRRNAESPVLGVFEIYASVNAMVSEAKNTQLIVDGVMLAVLTILYAVLLMIMQRARGIMETQQRTIEERNATLTDLSQRSLRREELEREVLANHLHEGVAQTLSAIKLAVESSQRGGQSDLLTTVVPSLQLAIRQIRSIAADLQPSGLNELGLVATLRASCNAFGRSHPGIHISLHVVGQETDIPLPLKSVIYRNVEAALKVIGQRSVKSEVDVELEFRRRDSRLTLVESQGPADSTLLDFNVDTKSPLSPIYERTVMSGGDLSMRRTATGAIKLTAVWSHSEPQHLWDSLASRGAKVTSGVGRFLRRRR